jgi:molybdate transport system permease protein
VSPLGPILLSLRVASLATLITLALGLALARLFTGQRFPLVRLWETLILLPMVFPPTITGYLLLILLGRRGPVGRLLGSLGIQLVFTWAAAVIASVTVALPLMYQNCRAALLGVDGRLEDAARTLGLTEGRIFRTITLPLALPGILAGVALAFSRALGEFGATLMVAGNIPGLTQTMPLALYSAVEAGREGEARIYLLVTTALSFLVILAVGLGDRESLPRLRGGGSPRGSGPRGAGRAAR